MEEKILTHEQLYMIMAVESKANEFQKQLEENNQQLQSLDRQRQQVVTGINQINGAVIAANILINDELTKAGVDAATYHKQKEQFLNPPAKTDGNVIPFPIEEGQDNETISRTDDDSVSSDS